MKSTVNSALLEQIEVVAEVIFAPRAEVDTVYLYGSVLSSTHFNDVDIGILLDEEFTPNALYEVEIIRDFEKQINQDFDVRILNGRPVRFLFQVISKSHVIFCRNERHRIMFEKRVMIDYFDIKYYFDRYDMMRRERYARRDYPIKN
ncbi:MAG: nucleotidyltransferase domain-containing protein [Candidatus Thorarchaeota archaeon]|nr:nucleotidyltransferase domain-containing protein [Candidatus Thorarchaeota archaeon]